ncbi:sigma-70 family RNA polymerase sigma factor [Alicyclobacillus macrosporangiidus]|uniref:RNA polymerase sporulation-specific sigma factor n=1 Tax=Alicyclobacillus macrosporangiidus TaxID=392015 RepID=A0A1I7IC59_9BACL|nr:sigma-70 family RNA polymerase sigma factor [Alicyclobacillus macrosporangiidus]SFU70524.1 RNA polymerase sporulation-specific sigma factor [Alicyclobacillus macrosporangiidus]
MAEAVLTRETAFAPDEVDQMVRDNMRLVHYVALQYQHKAAALGIDYDELVSAGMIGLWEGLMRYDPTRAKWTTCAVIHIKGRIRRLIRTTKRQNRIATVPLEHQVAADEDSGNALKVYDILPSRDDVTTVEIRDWMDKLPARERHVVSRYMDGYKQHEIGDEMGVSQAHVSRILRRTVQRYFEA